MIRRCTDSDFEAMWTIINDAAMVYEGAIPSDCWHQPYMSKSELRREIAAGVEFWGYEDDDVLVGLMGSQQVQDVCLIRHAYVLPVRQREGIGGALLCHLRSQADLPILIGTWADAVWAIRFYEKHGFQMVTGGETASLLRRYWSVPERQMACSVVLADQGWFYRR